MTCKQWRNRIDPEAEQRIADAGAERLQVRPPVRDAAALHAKARRIRAEHRAAEDHCPRRRLGCGHHRRDGRRRMLAIGIHRQDMGKAPAMRLPQSMQHRRTLPAIGRQHHDLKARIVPCSFTEEVVAAVRAAVHDDPDRLPCGACLAYRLQHPWPGVVAWDQDQVRIARRHRRAPCRNASRKCASSRWTNSAGSPTASKR